MISNDLSFDKQIILQSIKYWQLFSYSKQNLNCQYFPSCSNYFAQSIKNNFTYFGIIKGCDRILRCNFHAREDYKHNHINPTYTTDGRMIDELNPKFNKNFRKNTLIATSLSIVPGLGRVYSGAYLDGLLSFSSILFLSQVTSWLHENEYYFFSGISGSIGLTFWFSDFYGAYRASKLSKNRY